MPSSSKGRKGKLGKNKNRIKAYYGNSRNLWNKARRLIHHLRRFGTDPKAREALNGCLAGMPLHMSRSFNAAYHNE